MEQPQIPTRTGPQSWEHYDLWLRVREAVLALPAYFKTSTVIEGIPAHDIFTLSSALGAAIEDQVVQTLNAMRAVWDQNKKYQSYSFIRQSQTFPDVLLRKKTNGRIILMGIELKGWYLLDKEAMPNFRFVATPKACAAPDLLVVVPWALSNVLAGSPTVFSPFLESARYAAERRNYHWQYERQAKGNPDVILAEHTAPYPSKKDKIGDSARDDKGGNFGRTARSGILDDYMREALQMTLRGISAKDWVEFFKKHV